MDFLTNNSMLMMEKSMGFLWTKQAAILDNLANVETPEYKAKVVTFEENLRSRLALAAQGKLHGGDGVPTRKAVRQVLEQSEFAVMEPQEATRMDDNGVDATEQMIEMVRNAYQQQYIYNAIK